MNTLNSYISNFKNAINRIKNADQLVQEYPHLNSEYSKRALWLSKLFDEDGNRTNTKFDYKFILGVKEFGSNIGDSFKNLKRPDMLLMWVNAGLQGMYPFLRASDNSLERFIGVGELVSQDEINTGLHLEHLKNYMLDEADFQFKEELSGWDKVNKLQTVDATGKVKIKELRGIVFDIIKSRNSDLYNKLNNNTLEATYSAINKNIESINETLSSFIDEEVSKFIDVLQEARVIKKLLDGRYMNLGLSLYNEGGIVTTDKEIPTISDASLVSAMKRYFINDLFNNIEQTKVIVGHPVFYGNVDNFFKRMSGLTGTKKLVNTDEETNILIDNNLLRQDNKTTKSLNINNQPVIKTVVLADVKAYSDHINNYREFFIEHFVENGMSNSKAANYADELLAPYTEMVEADAQGYISMDEFSELLFRTGDWNMELEAWYQYETQEGWKGKEVKFPQEAFYVKYRDWETDRKSVV